MLIQSETLGLIINLPWPILAHAVFLGAYGLRLLLLELTDKRGLLGLCLIGLSLGYLCTAYMPYESNAFLYASVPARVVLGALAGSRYIWDRMRDKLETPESTSLLITLIYDGLSGLALGFWLDNYTGRAPRIAAL